MERINRNTISKPSPYTNGSSQKHYNNQATSNNEGKQSSHRYRGNLGNQQNNRPTSEPQTQSNNGRKKEMGMVNSLKDTFGFIKCVEQDDIFFSLSQAPRDIAIGDEVEFIVTENKGRWNAIRLSLLPKGTIKFEDILPGVYQGFVHHEARSFGNGRKDGSVKYTKEKRDENQAEEVNEIIKDEKNHQKTTETISFTIRDIATNGVNLKRGDEIEFEICVDLKTKQRRATNIKLIRTALEIEIANSPQEEGIICSLKDTFGFLQSTTKTQHVYFRFSDVAPNLRIEMGQEVSFNCIQEPTRPRDVNKQEKKYRASDISFLPKGSVAFEELVQNGLKGLVTRRPIENNERGRVQSSPGCITATLDKQTNADGDVHTKEGVEEEDLNVECIFKMSDMKQPVTLRIGDEVAFDLYRHKATKTLFSKNISILQFVSQQREHGIVSALKVKEGYGFIRCCEREEDLYFRLSEYMDGDMSPLKENIEVEFDIQSSSSFHGGKSTFGNSKLQAERIQLLMEGTVWFQAKLTNDSGQASVGKVIIEPKGNKPGLIKCDDSPQLSTAVEYLDVTRRLEEFIEDPQTKKMTIPFLGKAQLEAHVIVATELGLGYSFMGKEFIIFKFTNDEEKDKFVPPKRMPSDHVSNIVFQLEEAVEGYTPQKDDTVNFDLVMDRRSLRRIANHVVLKERPALKLGNAADGSARSLVFTSPRKMRLEDNGKASTKTLNSVTYKEARGPDKTLGFVAGWRERMRNGDDVVPVEVEVEVENLDVESVANEGEDATAVPSVEPLSLSSPLSPNATENPNPIP